MIILEFKLKGASTQYRAIDEAIRTTQFIRNKCVRLWQDTWGIAVRTHPHLSKMWAGVGPGPQRRINRSGQGVALLGDKLPQGMREVTLGESGAPAVHGRP
jgi:hypothetical protein